MLAHLYIAIEVAGKLDSCGAGPSAFVTEFQGFFIGSSMSEQAKGTLELRGESITLAQAVKLVGLAETGGQAKALVREGSIFVNGMPANQPAKQLRLGDRFGEFDGEEWTIVAESSSAD